MCQPLTAGIFNCRCSGTLTMQKYSYIRANGQGRKYATATKIYLRTVTNKPKKDSAMITDRIIKDKKSEDADAQK